MSILTVVRHAQASFLSENYDRLSPLGEQQSRMLADYWLDNSAAFDQVYCGPAERHRKTAEIVGELFRDSGRPWPEARVLEDLDEFPADAVMNTFVPQLMESDAQIAGWVHDLKNSQDLGARQRGFDRILREVSLRWLRGEIGSPDIPSWQDFCHRVESAFELIKRGAPASSRVAVFTSGGPKAVAVRSALGLGYESTLELTWSPRNCSYSEFLFTSGRFSLSTFNCTPHLHDASMLTYR